LACRDWSQLHLDLDEIGDDLVSLAAVADPFGEYDVAYLKRCFGDVVFAFKEHCVMDLRKPRREAVSPHHRRYAEKALRTLTIDVHPRPTEFLDEWLPLRKTLADKHQVRGIRAYSRAAFAIQLGIPGVVVSRAMYQGETVGAIVWFVEERQDVVYGHVLGYTDLGYKLGAQYALYWFALDYFRDRVRWCTVGGVPGKNDADSVGLAWFKRGWSAETRTAYFCGRIFNHVRYAEVVRSTGTRDASYFPAYRAGEMGV